MKVGVVGAGIAGMSAAWALAEDHEVTLYEANDTLGGHSRTVRVPTERGLASAATGFRFIIRESYPHVLALLELLEVPYREVLLDVTITRPGHETLVLPPRRPTHLLPLLRSGPRREVLAFRRFTESNRRYPQHLRGLSLEAYLQRLGFRTEHIDELLIPIVANSWGADPEIMRRFPAYNVAKLIASPGIIEVVGGNATTIAAIAAQLGNVEVRVGEAIRGLARANDGEVGVRVLEADGNWRQFDRVVLATEAHVAGRLVADFDPRWHTLLGGFEHFPARIAIHRDPSYMPAQRRDWSTVNLRCAAPDALGTMTMWCGKREGLDVFRSWLGPDDPRPRGTVYEESFRHLVVDSACVERQRQLAKLQGHRGLHVAGMYAGDADNHDGALSSALPIADALAPNSRVAASLRAGARRHAREPERLAG